MKLSSIQNASIEAAIEDLWTRTEFSRTDFPTVAPLYGLMDALGNVRCLEFAELNWKIVLRELQREAHLELEIKTAPETTLAGFVYANFETDPFDAFLFVNASDPIARRRFTVAHELGHLLLHSQREESVFYEGLSFAFSPTEEQRRDALDEGQSLTLAQHGGLEHNLSAQNRQREREADTFAARLLMPEVTCRRLWAQHQQRFGARPQLLARRLASDLLVSQLAAKIRLRELELLV